MTLADYGLAIGEDNHLNKPKCLEGHGRDSDQTAPVGAWFESAAFNVP